MDEEYRDIAKEEFGIGNALTVVNVTPGSSGERADIRVGDKIAAVDEEVLDDGEDAMEDLAEILDESGGKEDPTWALFGTAGRVRWLYGRIESAHSRSIGGSATKSTPLPMATVST